MLWSNTRPGFQYRSTRYENYGLVFCRHVNILIFTEKVFSLAIPVNTLQLTFAFIRIFLLLYYIYLLLTEVTTSYSKQRYGIIFLSLLLL